MTRNWTKTAAITIGVLAAGSGSAPAGPNDVAAATCQALERADFSGIPDAPTQMMESEMVKAAGDTPTHCHVQGYVAPAVGFELLLPAADWNGKFFAMGCGGTCGLTRIAGKVFMGFCDEAIRRGYACIVTDKGHRSTKEGNGRNSLLDGLWAYNNLQARIDYGFRAAHVASLAGKAITQRYYGTAPTFSYFMGGSEGGREALIEAQRFPWDYDGIIVVEPSINRTGKMVSMLWTTLALMDRKGRPLFTPADVDLLHNAVMAKCDAGDSLKDGIIDDPRSCPFDPVELTCTKGQTSGCLSRIQVEAAKRVYSGPVTSKGERIFYGSMLGSEKGTLGFDISRTPILTANFFRYMAFMPDPGPNWNPRDFDFDVDYKRLGTAASLYDASNPDLRQFKSKGGKLIILQGWNDDGLPGPLDTIDYYEAVERTMGGRARTQEFVRLFMVPGRGHGGGGPGASSFDLLSYLEAWVEQNQAPDLMVGSHLRPRMAGARAESEDWVGYLLLRQEDSARAKFTRPVYPYPLRARYKGEGDPNDYRNFEPVGP